MPDTIARQRLFGPAAKAGVVARAADDEAAERLWAGSAQWTGLDAG
jgi:hypothetical protein